MKKYDKIIFIYILLIFLVPCKAQETKQNSLTVNEKQAGWKLLFDGSTSRGWRGYNLDSFPSGFWEIKNGILGCVQMKNSSKESLHDIITIHKYPNFELKLDWKISKGANSGIMYFASESESQAAWQRAPEYQIIDDHNFPEPLKDSHLSGGLYDLIPPKPPNAKPFGEWNSTLIKVKNGSVEHWLNGALVLSYSVNDITWKNKVEKSKFQAYPIFKNLPHEGHIVLQSHEGYGNIFFRNIKIKEL